METVLSGAARELASTPPRRLVRDRIVIQRKIASGTAIGITIWIWIATIFVAAPARVYPGVPLPYARRATVRAILPHIDIRRQIATAVSAR